MLSRSGACDTAGARQAVAGAQVTAHHHSEVLLSSAAPWLGRPWLALKPGVI